MNYAKKNNTYTRRIPSSGTWAKADSLGDSQKLTTLLNKKPSEKGKGDSHRLTDVEQRKIIDDFNKRSEESHSPNDRPGRRAPYEAREFGEWPEEPRSSGELPEWGASDEDRSTNDSGKAAISTPHVEVKGNDCFILEDTTLKTI